MGGQLVSVRLWVLFLVSLVEMLLFSAPLLGWSSLLFVLKGEGVFVELCQQNSTAPSRHEIQGCSAQDERLNLLLTVAAFTNAVMMFITGWAIDRLSAKTVKIISSVLYAMSAGLLALTTTKTSMTLFAALMLIAVAYAGIYSSITRASTVFGRWQSAVNSLYNCAMSSSAVLFLVFKVLYERDIPYHTLCYGLVGLTCLLLISSIVIFPDVTNKDKGTKNNVNPDKASTPDSSTSKGRIRAWKDILGHVTCGVFVWTCCFVGMCRWRLWFFLGSFQQFMTSQPNVDDETVKSYANYYGIAQLCSLAMGPILWALIAAGKGTLPISRTCTKTSDDTSKLEKDWHISDAQASGRGREVRGCLAAFGSSAIILVLLNILMLIPSTSMQIFSFVLVTVLRCFYNGAVANLFLVAFPLKDYGKLMGISAILTAVIQCLQYPTFLVMENVFTGQIIWINIMFLVLSIPLLIGFPLHLWHYARRLDKQATSSKYVYHKCNTMAVIEKVIYERLTVV